MLQIDRQDRDQLRKWMADHEDLFEASGEEDTARELTFSDAYIPLFVAFLNGIVQVNKYLGGLTGLLEKAEGALRWFKAGKKATSDLALGERILALLLSSGRRRGAGMAAAQIAAITGASQLEVKSSLNALESAGIVACAADGHWRLLIQ